MRGHYELKLSDGKTVPLRFCTWSLKRFCQLQGIGPSDISSALSGEQSLDAIINLLKASAEYPLYKEGITPSFTDIEICDWIDDIGGMTSKQFNEIIAALGDSMTSGLEEKPINKKGKASDVKKN